MVHDVSALWLLIFRRNGRIQIGDSIKTLCAGFKKNVLTNSLFVIFLNKTDR